MCRGRPRETRLGRQGRGTTVWNVFTHEAATAGEERVRAARRKAAQLPTVRMLSSSGGRRADGRRARLLWRRLWGTER